MNRNPALVLYDYYEECGIWEHFKPDTLAWLNFYYYCEEEVKS